MAVIGKLYLFGDNADEVGTPLGHFGRLVEMEPPPSAYPYRSSSGDWWTYIWPVPDVSDLGK